jgi:uncharacterized SAM-binding protein YcdF (DUF218 family)
VTLKILKIVALVPMLWLMGFIWFGVSLPRPIVMTKVDAVVVPTGGGGRIARGLDMMDKGLAPQMLVTGVDPEVRPSEFAAEYNVSQRMLNCCVTLGFEAEDTRGNAAETAKWLEEREVTSLRLVTTDWHMRRAALELGRTIPGNVYVSRDAVISHPGLSTLFLEYNKLLAAYVAPLFGD